MSEEERSVAEFLKGTQLGWPASRYWILALAGAGAGVLLPLIAIATVAILRPDVDAFAFLRRMWTGLVGLGAIMAVVLVGAEMLGVRFDRRKAYWNRLPSEGRVALERMALQGAVAFWVHPVADVAVGTPRYVLNWWSTMAPRAQIVLARTERSWWIHADRVPPEWDGRPALWRTLARNIAIVYAPRTEIKLGIRVAGPEIPVVATSEELTEDELEMLQRATGSDAGDLPSGHVHEPDAVQAVDTLVRTRLGAAAGAIPGLSA